MRAGMPQNQLHIAPLDPEAGRAIIGWRYPAPYDLYNLGESATEEILADLLNPDLAYYKITTPTGELVAFCNFGIDARVPGGEYSQDALDIGLGIRPDLTGAGNGSHFVEEVLEFTRQMFHPRVLRVTIAGFNLRAQRVWQKAGFQQTQRFLRPLDEMEFLVFTRDAQPA